MTPSDPRSRDDETMLGWLLTGGTFVGCALLAAALLAGGAGGLALRRPLLWAGVGTFVLLPTLRVALMTVLFLRRRDYLLAIVGAAVLAIILLGCLLGTAVEHRHPTFQTGRTT